MFTRFLTVKVCGFNCMFSEPLVDIFRASTARRYRSCRRLDGHNIYTTLHKKRIRDTHTNTHKHAHTKCRIYIVLYICNHKIPKPHANISHYRARIVVVVALAVVVVLWVCCSCVCSLLTKCIVYLVLEHTHLLYWLTLCENCLWVNTNGIRINAICTANVNARDLIPGSGELEDGFVYLKLFKIHKQYDCSSNIQCDAWLMHYGRVRDVILFETRVYRGTPLEHWLSTKTQRAGACARAAATWWCPCKGKSMLTTMPTTAATTTILRLCSVLNTHRKCSCRSDDEIVCIALTAVTAT